ncbi:MAG: bactofilin family protein [Thermodesulfobacteriota bacterium]
MFLKEWAKGKDRSGSYLGDNVGGTGEINTNGLIRIDGHWEGNINADSIVIGETSLVKGNLKAKNIVINGAVHGKLEATELIEIHDKGNVQGDIKTARLVVVEKGVLQGKCHILRDMDEKVLEIAPREVSKGKKVSEISE